jgi:acetyl-CoA synthetase
MLWLMSRCAGYKPVIEYCGGTEIAGSFLSSTMVQPNAPSVFSTPVLGSNLMIINDAGESTHQGEIALLPPALGLSTHLLNRDHHECYYAGMPSGPNDEIMRRHGDEVQLLKWIHSDKEHEYYRALGRCDDTMNIGGIKISSVEIERVCNDIAKVVETAAIGVSPPAGGPSILVIFAIIEGASSEAEAKELGIDVASLKKQFQVSIKSLLNPLFHVGEVLIRDKLPRTASNKVMRRVLRDEYVAALATK